MNSTIALRLLWKEYRMQRGLWLAMAIGCFLFQGLFFLIMSNPQTPVLQESFQLFVSIAFLLTLLYAMGSGATTFSIEREEGTQIKPLMVGCPPGLTLAVKTIFGIVATTSLLALTVGSGMLLSLGSLMLPSDAIPVHMQGHPALGQVMVLTGLLFVALPYLGALLWSMLFSLVTRKVTVAPGLATIAMIVSFLAIRSPVESMLRNGRDTSAFPGQLLAASGLLCLFAISLLAMNYFLTHRWLTRGFFGESVAGASSLFRGWSSRRSGMAGRVGVETDVEAPESFKRLTPEVAVHQPAPRFGLSWLYASSGPNQWRLLRFLRWKEALETRTLYLSFLAATLAVVGLVAATSPRRDDWHALVAVFIHAPCVVCGVMAFRAEQEEKRFRRLAEMGLRPGTVWFSKHLVWLTRAFGGMLCILVCAMACTKSSDFTSIVWLTDLINDEVLAEQFDLTLPLRAAILVFTMYSIGQACSQLIRSTLVSLFAAFLLAITVFCWTAVCTYFAVPWSLSVLPLAIGCLLVTRIRTHFWMLDNKRVRTWTLPLVSLVAAIAFAFIGTGLFRVYQIPSSKPFFDAAIMSPDSSPSDPSDFDDGLTTEQRGRIHAPLTAEEQRTFTLYQRAEALNVWDGLPRNKYETSERWDALSDADHQAVEEAIRLLLEAADSPTCAKINPATDDLTMFRNSSTYLHMWQLIDLILFDARREIDAGNVDVALDRYRSAFAMSRHAAGRGNENHLGGLRRGTWKTLWELRAWSEHEDVDRELIEQAIQIIDDHRERMVPIEVENYADAIILHNTLNLDASSITELEHGAYGRLSLLLTTIFPGEQNRKERLLNLMESCDVEIMKSYRNYQAAAVAAEGRGMKQWYLDVHPSEALRMSAPTPYRLKFHDGVLRQTTPVLAITADQSAFWLCVHDISTECSIRATKLVLRLILQQRETNKLPATLAEFGPSLNDPWTDRPFIWYPEGLPGKLVRGSAARDSKVVVIKAHTPFLLNNRHQWAIEILPVEPSETDEMKTGGEDREQVEFFARGLSTLPWLLPTLQVEDDFTITP